MNNKVITTIEKYNMISNNDSVCIALSGGADSVSLFHFMVTNKKMLGIKNLYACHLNHMLRDDEADNDEKFVVNLCNSFNIEVFVKKVDINKKANETSKSIEEAARDERYDFFAEISKKYNCKIATAHTLSDSMETTLFNLSRGTGLKGLCGISPTRDYIIRPLITCSRREIEKYCCENELSFVTDSTNNTDLYTRNRIRHNIIPKFYELNPMVESSFLRFYSQGETDEDFLEQETDKAYKLIEKSQLYLRNEYLLLHKAIRYRVLAKILSDKSIDVYSARLELLDNYIYSGTGAVQLSKDDYLKVSNEYFKICENISQEYYEMTIPHLQLGNKEKIQLPTGKTIEFSLEHYEQNKNFENNLDKDLKKRLDYDRIKGNILLRQRKDGDKINLHKRNCTKSIKKLFNEMKIPTEKRNSQVVLCDEEEIIWVEGVGCSSNVATNIKTQNVLIINMED
ncbi:MAG: tRNA lysidine(34) synthetase TilS [Oscillospiraceae bacterium]